MFTRALLVGSFALGSYAQLSGSSFALGGGSTSTTASPVVAQTTMKLFIDAGDDQGFVGSIISADSCETTVALVCTEGDYGSGYLSATCNPDATAFATYGPGFFELSTAFSTAGVEATLSESCSLDGTTQAVCVASISASANGEHTATASTETKTGNQVNYYQVPITGGANRVQGLASCTNSGNAAAPTGAVDIVKVLVVPGAAAILAGIQAFA